MSVVVSTLITYVLHYQDSSSSMLGGDDARPLNFRGGRGNARPRKVDPTRLPWRLVDKNQKNLIGRRTDLDTSNYFVMVEKVCHIGTSYWDIFFN